MKVKNILIYIIGIFILQGCIIKDAVLEVTGNAYDVYKYDKTPCKDTFFTLGHDVILLENKQSALKDSLYGITRYSLENFKEYVEHEGFSIDKNKKIVISSKKRSYFHKEIKLYDANSTFKILGYYKHIDKRTFAFSHPSLYLVETNDRKKSMVA